jgi:hypothetical protein
LLVLKAFRSLINLPIERTTKFLIKQTNIYCSAKKDSCLVFSLLDIYDFQKLSFIFNSCMDSWALDKFVRRIQWILQNSSWKWLAGLSLCIWLCTCTWRAMQNCETSTPCDQYKLYVSCIFSELVKTHSHPCRHGFSPSPFILPPWKHRFDMLNHIQFVVPEIYNGNGVLCCLQILSLLFSKGWMIWTHSFLIIQTLAKGTIFKVFHMVYSFHF